MIKKKEIIIILSVALVCIIALLLFLPKKSGQTVIITQDNSVLYRLPLGTDKTVQLDNCTVKIENGFAFMESSNCGNQICVNTGKISKTGEQVICLPNKVIIEVAENEN